MVAHRGKRGSSGMRILVTGHRGYIGTVMVPMLLAEGHEVVGVDSGLLEDCTFGGPARDVFQVRKDIRDVEPSDLEGLDAVVHLAALSNDPLGNLDPSLTYRINHLASVRLARLAKEAQISRFLFSSSCSVYGAAGDDLVSEESRPRPLTPYARSKAMAERDISSLSDSGFAPTFLRSATAYGVSPRLRLDLVINNLVAWACTTGLVCLKSDGRAWRPVVHVRDITGAYITVLRAPPNLVHNQVFNVGLTEENYRICELARIVEELVPDSSIEYAEGATAEGRSYRVDCSKLARTLPEFKPQWNALRGVQQLCETFQEGGLTLEDLEGPRYKRVDHVRQLVSTGRLDANLRWREQQTGQHGHEQRPVQRFVPGEE